MAKLAGLEIFRRVAPARSFTNAAQALGISGAMASKTVAQLEAPVGARLLVSAAYAERRYQAAKVQRFIQLLVAELAVEAPSPAQSA